MNNPPKSTSLPGAINFGIVCENLSVLLHQPYTSLLALFSSSLYSTRRISVQARGCFPLLLVLYLLKSLFGLRLARALSVELMREVLESLITENTHILVMDA